MASFENQQPNRSNPPTDEVAVPVATTLFFQVDLQLNYRSRWMPVNTYYSLLVSPPTALEWERRRQRNQRPELRCTP